MSLYGRFFNPKQKNTLRKVLDRTRALSAVECLAYIKSENIAMKELYKKKDDNDKLVYDNKENDRHDIEHQPYIDYINEVISRQGKSTEGDIQANTDLICIRDIIAADILSVYDSDGYGSTNYDNTHVMDELLLDESSNITMWPSMRWACEWNPSTKEYQKLYDKYLQRYWDRDSD